MTNLKQSLILFLAKGIVYGFIMWFIAHILQIYSPLKSWEQIGTITALAAFLIKFYDDNSLKTEHRIGSIENSIDQLQSGYSEISSCYKTLSDKSKKVEYLLDRLNIQVVEHLKLYSHEEAAADIRKIQQEILAIQAELRYGFDILDIKKRLEKIDPENNS